MLKIVKTAQTKENNTITLYETTNENFDKTILLVGVFHGEEPQGNYLLNKYIFQYEQCREYVHRRGQLLEFAAYEIDQHIGDHSDQDAV